MIKSELIKRISSKNPHLFERDIEKVVNAILNEMIEALRRGDRVELRGFGAFSAKLREATSRGSRSTWSAYANANLPMASSNSSLEARDTPLMVAGFSVTFECARASAQPQALAWKRRLTQIKQASGAFVLSLIGVRTRNLGYHDVFEGNLMKSACILLVMFSVLGFSTAQAQTTIDVGKITCRQFLLGHVGGSTRSVANWLSGYYNGKRGNTVIEVGSMQKNVRDLERYCRKNHEMPVMDAAKNALGAEK